MMAMRLINWIIFDVWYQTIIIITITITTTITMTITSTITKTQQ